MRLKKPIFSLLSIFVPAISLTSETSPIISLSSIFNSTICLVARKRKIRGSQIIYGQKIFYDEELKSIIKSKFI